MSEKIRWGIIGTGFIAKAFATGLSVIPDAELVAVGSRSEASANKFADVFNIPNRYASYKELAADSEVDVVYIGTPHSFHKENSLLCLENGKAVLCEKPFTINAAETEEVINLARKKNLFLMEAMWTRFLPLTIKLRQLLADDVIGQVQMLTADLGFKMDFDPQNRLFNPHLGGGALLDVGVYTVSWASMLFGQPNSVTSKCLIGETGVDDYASVILDHDQGQLATLYMSIRAATPSEVVVIGSEGRIRVHTPMFKPVTMTLSKPDQDDEVFEVPYEGNGYNYQAIEVMRCMRAGKLESETMPLDESLVIMKTMDQIRAQWGLKYPME